MASERKSSSSRGPAHAGKKPAPSSRGKRSRKRDPAPAEFAVCVRNDGYPASLELRKLYHVLEDSFGEEHGLIRIVDESGDDYLYPSDYFVRVRLPVPLEKKLHRIA